MELGCDARGYSRAGSDTKIWYCIILAGRQSQELNKMREVSIFAWILLQGILIVICWSQNICEICSLPNILRGFIAAFRLTTL